MVSTVRGSESRRISKHVPKSAEIVKMRSGPLQSGIVTVADWRKKLGQPCSKKRWAGEVSGEGEVEKQIGDSLIIYASILAISE